MWLCFSIYRVNLTSRFNILDSLEVYLHRLCIGSHLVLPNMTWITQVFRTCSRCAIIGTSPLSPPIWEETLDTGVCLSVMALPLSSSSLGFHSLRRSLSSSLLDAVFLMFSLYLSILFWKMAESCKCLALVELYDVYAKFYFEFNLLVFKSVASCLLIWPDVQLPIYWLI